MMNVAVIGSVCHAEYLTDVSGGGTKWLPVKGDVRTGSTDNITQDGLVTYIDAYVLFQTLNGPKIGRISSCSKKVQIHAMGIAYIGCTVSGTRLRNGKIVNMGAGKVVVDG